MQPPTVVYVELQGNLGNQMFQIAAAYAHAHRQQAQGAVLRISNCSSASRTNFTDMSLLHKCQAYVGDKPSGCAVTSEPHFHYAPIPNDARSLRGYYQSSLYFADVKDTILDLFDAPTGVKTAVHTTYARYLENKYAVVVHVRCGDYMSFPTIHGILTPLYYKTAMQRFRDARGVRCSFYVFSDDIAYCRTAFEDEADVSFIDEPDMHKALYFMSQFRYYVLANSSFSWWAAYSGTAAETVMVPERWFGPHGPQDYNDIYEPDWIRLPVS